MIKESHSSAETATEVSKNPELIFGLVGPIGVDLDFVMEKLCSELDLLNYKTHKIRLSDKMKAFDVDVKIDKESFLSYYDTQITFANKFREKCGSPAAMAGLTISEIRNIRAQFGDEETPLLGNAFIVRQFKRPEEIQILRKTYGRKFVLISVYLDEESRKKELIHKIQNFNFDKINEHQAQIDAVKLIQRDQNEETEKLGQRVSDIFHLGDVFVYGKNNEKSHKTIRRFLRAFFGHNGTSPTKSEYGMYTAAAASLRSIDLSRQVGAAIFSQDGDVISLGCNEVPKAFGGTYWDDDDADKFRDFEKNEDRNQSRKYEIINDLIKILISKDVIPETDQFNHSNLLEKITNSNILKGAQIMDIIEFGRIIHAEMCAITDAARLGKPIKDSFLFCTTFPCHMCAKHIVSSGIKKVFFLEPYPKSYAKELHNDSITFSEEEADKKVLFQPFIGISPRRYRDIFEKNKRKDEIGKAKEWKEGSPFPCIEDRSSSYISNENSAMAATLITYFGNPKSD
ncbi:anti-phage dCTP deaminase [Roseibium aggregatum]|uniref:Deoxycytidylate deaminase n=1 Tax=Roseibium aggregatum TaxID=187304 RepID=A0A0M6Y9Y9_9HYPH|nr:anti-phage dCTP deaminase [Roseibium aggregatum]CTQ46534.1 deoxycytidylate deaminase [Roseibium aggregatum]